MKLISNIQKGKLNTVLISWKLKHDKGIKVISLIHRVCISIAVKAHCCRPSMPWTASSFGCMQKLKMQAHLPLCLDAKPPFWVSAYQLSLLWSGHLHAQGLRLQVSSVQMKTTSAPYNLRRRVLTDLKFTFLWSRPFSMHVFIPST